MKNAITKRLIYAVDMRFEAGLSLQEVTDQAKRELAYCCKSLDGLGITLKGNTIFRILGAEAFKQLADAGCSVFADYKLFDTQATCQNDCSWLATVPNLEILTVQADVHSRVFEELSRLLPATIIAPVKVLTDLDDEYFIERDEGNRKEATQKFFAYVTTLKANGIICSPIDLECAPTDLLTSREIITPGIRPAYLPVESDQNAVNSLTPTEAIALGADRLVIGAPLRYQNNLRDNAKRVLEEISLALEAS